MLRNLAVYSKYLRNTCLNFNDCIMKIISLLDILFTVTATCVALKYVPCIVYSLIINAQ